MTGVDFSPEGINLAKQRYPDVAFEVADVVQYRPSNQFDVVVCSEVLEHIEDQEALLENINSLLRPGGFLILTCPNGKVRRYFDGPLQPIENWPRPSRLQAMVSKKLNVLHYETFDTQFSHEGALRLRNSVKIQGVMRRLGLWSLYVFAFDGLGYGLYQVICARKPGP